MRLLEVEILSLTTEPADSTVASFDRGGKLTISGSDAHAWVSTRAPSRLKRIKISGFTIRVVIII